MKSSSSTGLLLAAVAVPVAGAAGLGAVRQVIDPAAAALLMVLVIVAFSLRGSWLVDALVSLTSALSYDFFLTAPFRSFAIDTRHDIQVTVALLLVGAAIGAVSRWALTQTDLAERRGEYVTAALAASAGGLSRAELARRLAGLVGADGGVWIEGEPPRGEAVIESASRMRNGEEVCDPARAGFPTDRFICFPAGDGYVRVAAAARRVRPSAEQMRAACLLASQVR